MTRKQHIGLARCPFAEQGDRLRVTPEHVIGAALATGPSDVRRKGIEAKVCFDHLDSPCGLTDRDQDVTKSMVDEIRVEREGAFELGNAGIMPALPVQGPSKSRVRQRQPRVEL